MQCLNCIGIRFGTNAVSKLFVAVCEVCARTMFEGQGCLYIWSLCYMLYLCLGR
jgi:hypothetical protein